VDNVISAWSKNKYHNFKRFFTKDIEEIKLLVISSPVYIVKKGIVNKDNHIIFYALSQSFR